MLIGAEGIQPFSKIILVFHHFKRNQEFFKLHERLKGRAGSSERLVRTMKKYIKNKETVIDFGDAVRVKRTEKKLSQERLSEMANITRNTVSNIEVGSDTSLSTAVALASVLNLSLDNIFELNGDRNLNPQEFTLIHIFHRLSENGKKQLLDTAKIIDSYDSNK